MGEHDRQQAPAKSSGVSAEDLVRAPDLGAVSVTPNQESIPQTIVGDQWIDHGAVCDGKQASTPGCLFSDLQRMRLIIDFKDRVQKASSNYKDALQDLRVDELMKKDDDLNWVISLALDLAGAHLAVSIGKALKTLKSSWASRLSSLALDAGSRGEYSDKSWSSRTERALEMVSNNRIDQLAKLGGDKAKTMTSDRLNDELNHADQTAKAATLSYIDQLRNGCDAAFHRFESHATGYTTDAELFTLWESMDDDHHTFGAYKQELAAKLSRFRASGVTDIGRKEVYDRDVHESIVHHDTRVVFVQSLNGTKTLWYQSQEGDRNPSVVRPCDPGNEGSSLPGFKNASCSFGPRHPREPAQLDRPVPEEFRTVAVARSEQLWGPIETIDDGYVSYLKNHGLDVAKAYQRVNGPRLPAGSVFANQPSAPLRARGGLPPDSIFAPAIMPHDHTKVLP